MPSSHLRVKDSCIALFLLTIIASVLRPAERDSQGLHEPATKHRAAQVQTAPAQNVPPTCVCLRQQHPRPAGSPFYLSRRATHNDSSRNRSRDREARGKREKDEAVLTKEQVDVQCDPGGLERLQVGGECRISGREEARALFSEERQGATDAVRQVPQDLRGAESRRAEEEEEPRDGRTSENDDDDKVQGKARSTAS